jgi:hypothetical protein
MQPVPLSKQFVSTFYMLWIKHSGIYRAHFSTLGGFEVAHTLSTFVGVDYINLLPL